jgi:hypothetical protein
MQCYDTQQTFHVQSSQGGAVLLNLKILEARIVRSYQALFWPKVPLGSSVGINITILGSTKEHVRVRVQ